MIDLNHQLTPGNMRMFHTYHLLLNGRHPYTLKSMPGGWILTRTFQGRSDIQRLTRAQAQTLLNNSTRSANAIPHLL